MDLRFPLSLRVLLAATLALCGLSCASAAVRESVEKLTVEDSSERALFVVDDAQPVAQVLLVFPGGDGSLGLGDSPPAVSPGAGFIGALRKYFVRPGTAIVLMDSPTAHRSMPVEYRETPEHRAWLAALVARMRERFPKARLIGVGYSNGAVSALIAGREPGVSGVVLLAGIFRRYADLGAFGVEVPMLVVHHEVDRCVPPDFDEPFRRVLKPTMVRNVAQQYGSELCGPVSAHQFYGQETTVAAVVLEWLDTGRAPLRAR